jgi:hypothetical protein
VTGRPATLDAPSVRYGGTVMTGEPGGTNAVTVTVNDWLAATAALLVAVQLTVVAPTGNVDPDAGVLVGPLRARARRLHHLVTGFRSAPGPGTRATFAGRERYQDMRRILTATTTAAALGGSLLLGGPANAAAAATQPAPPVAAGPVVASLTAYSPVSAGGGWVVWSVPHGTGWVLEGRQGGVTRQLAAAPRAQPFDASVGSDTHGAAVVTFSRCARTPRIPPLGLGVIAPLTGSGCRVHVLSLASGHETTPAIPHPRGVSDTTPAMWHGRIAFARLDPAHHGDVQQVLLWTPGRPTLTSLRHGALPAPCSPTTGCASGPRSGSVEGLAYDGRYVSFLWQPVAPGVFGDAGWEVRADRVQGGSSRIVTSGVAGEVCTGGTDLSAPSPPVLDGSTVRVASLQSTCYVFKSVLSQMDAAAPGNGSFGALPGVVLALAEHGQSLYALEAPAPATETDPTCTPAAPCQLEQITAPPLRPEPHKPTSPFA